MKKLLSILTALIMTVCLTTTAFAADYADIQTAYDDWENLQEYPVWVASVCYTDENPDGLTILVISEEGEAELLSMLDDTSDVLIYVDEEAIPYYTLLSAYSEIYENYFDEDGVFYLDIGWTVDEDGEVVGFGSTGLESRVEVGVVADYVEEYTALFADLYGDAVVVLEIESGSSEATDDDSYVAVETTEEDDASEAVAIEVADGQEDGENLEEDVESEVIEDDETDDALTEEAEAETDEASEDDDEDEEMTFTDYLLACGIIVLVFLMIIFNKRTR